MGQFYNSDCYCYCPVLLIFYFCRESIGALKVSCAAIRGDGGGRVTF